MEDDGLVLVAFQLACLDQGRSLFGDAFDKYGCRLVVWVLRDGLAAYG